MQGIKSSCLSLSPIRRLGKEHASTGSPFVVLGSPPRYPLNRPHSEEVFSRQSPPFASPFDDDGASLCIAHSVECRQAVRT